MHFGRPWAQILIPTLFYPGAVAFKVFQDQMRFLLNKVRQDGQPADDNMDIGAQVIRRWCLCVCVCVCVCLCVSVCVLLHEVLP
jgi:hypothetical protein